MLQFPRWKMIMVWLECFAAALAALPNVLHIKVLDDMARWLPHQPMNLGLDLQGGSYLLLEVDVDTYMKERLTDLQDQVLWEGQVDTGLSPAWDSDEQLHKASNALLLQVPMAR